MEAGQPKRLYRTKHNRMVGGVFGGLGEYFGIEPMLIRGIYALVLILSILVVLVPIFLAEASFIYAVIIVLIAFYIVLWIMVPEHQHDAGK
jgi:phage shock protein C